MQKKNTHPGKKSTKALQPIKKKQPIAKKHYGAFKSTRYDPCNSTSIIMTLKNPCFWGDASSDQALHALLLALKLLA